MKIILRKNSYTLLLLGILIALIVTFSILSPHFFTWKNFRNILNQTAIYLVISIGVTLVISMGEIDLSVGSLIGFSGMIMGVICRADVPPVLAVILGLAIAAGVGCANGILVSFGKINSFIVTLAMMTILRGITLVVTNAKPIAGFPALFDFFGSGKVGPVNVPIIMSLAIAAGGGIILHKTVLGNYCLFCGTNEIAANRAGVNVKKIKMIIFALCGLFAGVAGLIATSRIGSAEPNAGMGYEMDAIAAAILGGTSMQGGKGNAVGTVIACYILYVVRTGLVILSVSKHYQLIITGGILIVAVLISEMNKRKRSEI